MPISLTPTSPIRRRLLLAGAAAPFVPTLVRAQGSGWKPSKPITVIVPYPAGGLFDNIARQLGQRLSVAMNNPVIVDNRPGANTMIGATAAARAQPDGHTILFATDATVSIAPYLYKKVAYDPDHDFTPVTLLCDAQECIIANATLAAANLPALIGLAKQKPEGIAYGSYGMGSNAHLTGEMMQDTFGVQFTHVPYKGQAELYQAMLNNDIQFVPGAPGLGTQHIRTGRLKVLTVLGEQRAPLFPEITTAREQGLPLPGGAWFGFLAPAKTPPAAIATLGQEISTIAAEPQFRDATMTQNGLIPLEAGPAAFARRLVADKARYQPLLAKLGLKLD